MRPLRESFIDTSTLRVKEIIDISSSKGSMLYKKKLIGSKKWESFNIYSLTSENILIAIGKKKLRSQ
eukprot:snap_masked-scaffold_1-processed-gene-14.38-mRNA-1 protein AED:1.00 eAED:1.00 QI:0/0/0/0/1/1/3/0/66